MKVFTKKILGDKKGFTLIELMIMVMILTILTSFAIPIFFKYRSQSMQTEATILLASIWTNEVTYFGEKSEFSMENSVLSFDPITDPKFYHNWYINVWDDGLHFIATCSTNLDNDIFLDSWRVTDTDKAPFNFYDDISDMSH
ncbi:MAG: prepilin-type N-terminal cleavage/methylation domain-containing protein [Deltaproteobacteria bacterium]|uniref:Prepilin-type N-terminal cleavage/methylation domain-containing protein n=1 Tax=Candidatus Zymogenus saltonus TaxID=2844893 RepID=A0A9D8KFH8_9DELT|nr:prepilin-type N-terminal cleavage/methylation domain-containing protein [Candidatus Zymogenus saltonus]